MPLAKERLICQAVDDILDRVRELPGPKDAVMALMLAHMQLTIDDGMSSDEVKKMLDEYRAKFLGGMFELAYPSPPS
jgi:hypothetical protein